MKEERQEQMETNEKLINFFYETVESLSKISRDEVRDVVNLATITVSDSDSSDDLKKKSFVLLCYIAMRNFLSVEERWSLYWGVRQISFESPLFEEYDTSLDKIYASIYFEVEKAMPKSLLGGGMPEVENAPVVIVTSQFLTLEHEMTSRVMDYAYAIQREMRTPVVIINAAEINQKEYPYMQEYSSVRKMGYKDIEFPFYQASSAMIDLQEIANIVYNIKNLSPRLVLNVGESCLTSDLCRHFTKTASIPCTTALPTSMAEYLILCRELRNTDKPKVEALQPWQKVVEAAMNYTTQDMLEKLFADIDVDYSAFVDESKFCNVFGEESQVSQISEKLDRLSAEVCFMQKRLRDNEWAVVFNSTINGSEWFKETSLSPGRCAIGYPGLYALYRSLDEFQPKRILEIGLGQSTKVIGAYAEYFQAEHYIVEHDKSWIEFFLDKHGAKENTEIVCLERKEALYSGRWIQTQTPIKYYDKFAEKFSGGKFDFIFVDGPQGSSEYSRVDITEILPECLADSFVIMIDDAERGGEQRTISSILTILNAAGIAGYSAIYDGLKNTAIIVSQDLEFLCSL